MNQDQLRQSAVHGALLDKHTYKGTDRSRVSDGTPVRILRPSAPDLVTRVASLHHRSDHSVFRRVSCSVIVLFQDIQYLSERRQPGGSRVMSFGSQSAFPSIFSPTLWDATNSAKQDTRSVVPEVNRSN